MNNLNKTAIAKRINEAFGTTEIDCSAELAAVSAWSDKLKYLIDEAQALIASGEWQRSRTMMECIKECMVAIAAFAASLLTVDLTAKLMSLPANYISSLLKQIGAGSMMCGVLTVGIIGAAIAIGIKTAYDNGKDREIKQFSAELAYLKTALRDIDNSVKANCPVWTMAVLAGLPEHVSTDAVRQSKGFGAIIDRINTELSKRDRHMEALRVKLSPTISHTPVFDYKDSVDNEVLRILGSCTQEGMLRRFHKMDTPATAADSRGAVKFFIKQTNL